MMTIGTKMAMKMTKSNSRSALSESLEEQFKAIEWAKAEHKKI